jgi:choline dehydrogenase-like flavoprotein
LAVGPVESWRLISNLLPDEPHHHQQFKNSPVIRGIAFNARGRNAKTGFAVGQSVAKLSLGGGQNCYVSFIDGQSIPISDWLTFIPLKNRFTAWIISKLRKYFVAHMVFFSSDFCLNTITKLGNEAIIQGSHTSDFPLARDKAKKNLKEFFWTNIMIPIPFLWSLLPLGSDIHYGGTVPMNAHSGVRTDESCQVSGHPGVFLIDASWMPRIPEKPHTFTLIANAARVADDLLEIVYPGQRVPNNEKRQ